jgi:acetyltransferase-like isoleucine patch superfamily enzyme
MIVESSTTPSDKLFSLLRSISLQCFSGITTEWGILLRRLIYPRILAKMEQGVAIAEAVEIYGSQHIELHCQVTIERHSCLNAMGGKIILGDRARVNNTAFLNCYEAGGQIEVGVEAVIDRGVMIGALGGSIKLGANSYLGPYCCLAGPGHISIGANCLIASHSGLYGNEHIFSDLEAPIAEQGTTNLGIVIEDDCWLGTGVKVLDGVRIGRGSVIGAGAVVTKDLPPLSVAIGVPAKVIRQRTLSE